MIQSLGNRKILGLIIITVSLIAIFALVMNLTASQNDTKGNASQRVAWNINQASEGIDTATVAALHEASQRIPRGDQAGSDDTLVIEHLSAEGNWAVLSGIETDGSSQGAPKLPGEPISLIARKSGDHWAIVSPNDPAFCDQLRQVPDRLVSKEYYIGCNP